MTEKEIQIHGHKFVMIPDNREISGWQTDGKLAPIFVSHPQENIPCWRVWVPQMERYYDFEGGDARERAFSVAALYAEQQVTPLKNL